MSRARIRAWWILTDSPRRLTLSKAGEQAIFGTDTAEYQSLAARVAARLADTERPNSRRAHAEDWAAWTRYCEMERLSPIDVCAVVLADYAAALADGRHGATPLAPASIRRRVSGVVVGWRAAELVIPEGVSERAREVAERHKRALLEQHLPTGRGPAPALELHDLHRLCRMLPDTVGGARDRALILVGFGIGARRSELANLQVGDITETSEGITVNVRFSKTKQRAPGIPRGKRDETCAVTAWRAWRDVSGVTEGAAFRQVSCHGRVGGQMSPRAVGEAITRAAERAGITLRITGHSLRAGMATEARKGGADVVQIARQGGWSETSASLYGYIRTVDKWADNAMKGVL